jgi:type VI secretion system protein ImpC
MTDESRIRSAEVSLGPRAKPDAGSVSGSRRLRMAWVGALRGQGSLDRGAAGPRTVDKDALRRLLQEWRPRLEIEVPNLLGASPPRLEVELSFADFRDFRPEAIAESVPALSGLLAVRRTLERLVNEPIELETLAERLITEGADAEWAARFQRALLETRARPEGSGSGPAPAATAPPPGERGSADPLAGLLSMVDLPGGVAPAPPGSDPFQRFIRTLAGATGRQRRLEKTLAQEVIGQLDEALGGQLAAVLHHPRFLALESAWRGLKFVVDRTDFRKGIEIEVLDAEKEELAEAIEQRLVGPELDSPRDPCLAAVWVDHEFDATVRDVETLTRLAHLGEALQAPLVAAVGPAFFGVSRSAEVNGLSPLWDHLKRPEFIPFASLAREEASQFLALTFPRLLTRMPYGAQGDPVRGFAWAEDGARIEELPWGRAVAGLAVCVAASHAETGWPASILGSGGGTLTDLPIAEVTHDGTSTHLPLDAALRESILEELDEAGFVALGAPRNGDTAFVHAAPSIHRVARRDSAAETLAARREASLRFRLLAAQVMGVLRRLAATAPAGPAPAIQEHLEAGLAAELALPRRSDRLAVAIETAEEAPGRVGVGVHLRLPVLILGGEAEMDLSLEIGR